MPAMGASLAIGAFERTFYGRAQKTTVELTAWRLGIKLKHYWTGVLKSTHCLLESFGATPLRPRSLAALDVRVAIGTVLLETCTFT